MKQTRFCPPRKFYVNNFPLFHCDNKSLRLFSGISLRNSLSKLIFSAYNPNKYIVDMRHLDSYQYTKNIESLLTQSVFKNCV